MKYILIILSFFIINCGMPEIPDLTEYKIICNGQLTGVRQHLECYIINPETGKVVESSSLPIN